MWAPEAHNSNNILKMPLGVLKHDDNATIDWYTVHNRERWKCKPYFWWSSSLLPTLPKHCIVCSESGEKTNPIFYDHDVASFQLFQNVAQSAQRAVKNKPYFLWSCSLLQLFQNIAQFAHLESQPQKQITSSCAGSNEV